MPLGMRLSVTLAVSSQACGACLQGQCSHLGGRFSVKQYCLALMLNKQSQLQTILDITCNGCSLMSQHPLYNQDQT